MAKESFQAVLHFWFDEIDSSKWWVKDRQFDLLIAERFGQTLDSAVRCELFDWRKSAQGRLAEVIVLDQFSRNIYRDTPQAFAADPQALALAQEAVALGEDKKLSVAQRNFLYMPYMHSESLAIHKQAVPLFTLNDSPATLEFEIKHKEIIDKFGRYPHRNTILGRTSTAAEVEFLKGQNSGF